MSKKSFALPSLYHKGKTGKVVQWNVWTEGAEIHVEWGQIDGAMQHTMTKATVKNVGKKNEVNPENQAVIEARAMHKHRLDRKYSLTVEEAQNTVFLPMLAHPFDKVKEGKKPIQYPVDVQPKLDGNRALAYWEGDQVVLMSRGGKTWDIKHIQDGIAKFLPEGLILDGEIYKPGLNLQGINKLVKKFRPGTQGTESLQFWAFDIFDPEKEDPWIARKSDLEAWSEHMRLPVVPVRCVRARNEKEVMELMQQYVEEGYEGAIIRTLEGLYTLGERSRDLLKVKAFQDDEFEIFGHYVGEGKHEGCVGFWCKTKDGKEFKCYPRGTLEQRREYGKDPEALYGEFLTVRYQFMTDDGKPFLPIGICIRDERDQP